MDTRVNKYSDNGTMSRVSKNEELYRQINNEELDNFSVRSNATVIGNQEQEIDIEKLKKILDMRYNDAPKRRSIRVEPKEEVSMLSEEPTKEYDLTKILEKAKDEKSESYEEIRAKKLRNTQFDILNNLNLEIEEQEEEEEVKEKKPRKAGEDDLMELINTIALNETKSKILEESADPLDILSDLKGDENTMVYESMQEDIKDALASDDVLEAPLVTKPIEEVKEKVEEEKKEEKIDDSFYTKNVFKKKDFEDDFVEDIKLGMGVKILIVLVIICFIVGIFLFLKSFL